MRTAKAWMAGLAVLGLTALPVAAQPGETSGEGAPEAATTSAQGEPAAPEEEGAPSAADQETAGDAEATAANPEAAAADPAAAVSEGETSNEAVRELDEIDAGTYAVKLRDLEQRINELKEQIFRSKARLSLLAETVLHGVVAGAQTVITHENQMSNSFKLVKAVYALDGAPILNRADEEGGLGDRKQFDVYNGSIVPGEHNLTVSLEYRGHGYGIFSYLKGYRFKVRSSHTFTAPEGKLVEMQVVAYEKGGPTAPLEERPAVRYVERIADVAEAAPPVEPEATEAAPTEASTEAEGGQ